MNINRRRLEKGWSQEELARHSGLSTRTIQRIESGQRAGLESLKSLAAVFETSVGTLMKEQDMNAKQHKQVEGPSLSKVERQAIGLARSILEGPQGGKPDPLGKLERKAIDQGKRLLKAFGRGD